MGEIFHGIARGSVSGGIPKAAPREWSEGQPENAADLARAKASACASISGRENWALARRINPILKRLAVAGRFGGHGAAQSTAAGSRTESAETADKALSESEDGLELLDPERWTRPDRLMRSSRISWGPSKPMSKSATQAFDESAAEPATAKAATNRLGGEQHGRAGGRPPGTSVSFQPRLRRRGRK